MAVSSTALAKAFGVVQQHTAAGAAQLVGQKGIAHWELSLSLRAQRQELQSTLIDSRFTVSHRFDDTRIYQRSLQLVRLSREVIDILPTGYGFLADQLRRATASVPLTFAEGYGKRGIKEQRRFFAIARGSACEVAAILDVAHEMGVLDPKRRDQGRELCDHLARMLTLFRSQ